VISLDDIEAFEMSDQQRQDEERVKRIKERAKRGARAHRLMMDGDDWAALRYINLLEDTVRVYREALEGMIQNTVQAQREAMGVFDRKGNRTD